MTDRLHRGLEPGERIVFQTRRRSLLRYWQSKLADWIGTTLLGPAILFPFSGAPIAEFGEIYLMAAGIIAVAYPVWLTAVSAGLLLRRDQVIVTDRRVLHASGGLFDWTTRSVALTHVKQVEAIGSLGPNAVRLRGKSRSLLIPEMANAMPLRAALKKAIRVKRVDARSWPARLEVEKIGFLAAWAGIMMAGFLALSGLGLVDMEAAPGTGLFILLALMLIGMVGGFALGPSLAYLVALGAARPFLSQQRMRRIVETSDWIPEWNGALVRRWVGLLYGRPLDSRPG